MLATLALRSSALMFCLLSALATAADPALQPEQGDKRPSKVDEALDGKHPFTPDEIRQLVQRLRENQRAAASVPLTTLKGRVISVDLSPGAEIHTLRVRSGYLSLITIYDSTGAPWPIEAHATGYDDALDIKPVKPTGEAFLTIAPKSNFPDTNLSIHLKGLPRAVIIRVAEGTDQIVDTSVDIRVPAMGPNAVPPIIDRPNLVAGDDPRLTAVLQGLTPERGQALNSSAPSVRAWLVGSELYVRTRAEVLSPAYKARMRSSDGTSAYLLGDRPIIVVSENGQPVSVTLRRVARP